MTTIIEANSIDRETRNLTSLYSRVRIKVGLELAKHLFEIESDKLYSKIDKDAYPNFIAYLSSLGMSYHTCRQLISMYQAFVLVAGYSINELSEIPYQKLAVIKPELFDKKDGQYTMVKSKKETDKWISDAKSDLTINDLKQKRKELSVGEHKCEFEIITYKRCVKCGLKTK